MAATNTKDQYDENKEEQGDKVECEGGATEEASNKASSNCTALSNHDHPSPSMMILQLLLPFLSSLSLRRRLWFLVLQSYNTSKQ